ncbi:MAG: hypothetical protein D3924_00385 [Candidatus Electrothrix sp. AR4]|nr:hypothetical protein [Candidatus Electrothrix sp. AR4]
MWGITEAKALHILVNEQSWLLSGFAHCLAMLLSLYYLYLLLLQENLEMNAALLISNPVLLACVLIAAIPVIGPAGIIFFASSFKVQPIILSYLDKIKFLPEIKTVAKDEYAILDDQLLKSCSSSIAPFFFKEPRGDLVDLIHGNLDQGDTSFILHLMEHLPWTPHKTRILQMLLEYTRYPKIIVSAASLLAEKKNTLFNRIAELEKKKKKMHYYLPAITTKFII